MKQKLCKIFTGFVMSLVVWNFAWAEPIEIVVPTVPGGAIDMTGRAISKSLTAQGVENIVSYYPGAGGEIAVKKILEKQNNVIMVGSMSVFVFADVTKDRENQLAKTTKLFGPSVTNPMMFVVGTGSKFSSFDSLITTAKTQEQPCGVSNVHGEILLREMNQRYGTKFVPVMYKGTGQLIPDIMGNHVQCAFDQTAPYIPLGNKVKWLATSTAQRIKDSVPTINTLLPNFHFDNWYASAVPANSNLLENRIVVRTLQHWSKNNEIVQPLVDQGFHPEMATPELTSVAARSTEYYRTLLKK